MEYLKDEEIKNLVVILGYDKEDKQKYYEIKKAILDVVNDYLGISAQKVVKVLENGLKTHKNINNLTGYIKQVTLFVIENRKNQVYKPVGRFVNMVDVYNDFRENGVDGTDIEKKYIEILFNHIAYENPYVKVNDLFLLHKKALKVCNKTLKGYISEIEKCLFSNVKVYIPRDFLWTTAEEKIKENKEILASVFEM